MLLVFPPVVMMCRFHFDIYEEAEAYAYLGGIGLFLGLVALARAPSKGKYLVLTALAQGWPRLVRPTLLTSLWRGHVVAGVLVFPPGGRFAWGQSILGVLFFVMGGLLLYVTNLIRFWFGV